MAYGLPVKGQADYDDELNNSIEAVRSDAALAKSTADGANTSANAAKTDATNAVATANQALDFVRTTSDDRVAEHVNDATSATTAALTASYVALAPEPTGVAATDTANLLAAINAAIAAGGGDVHLQAGTYAVTNGQLVFEAQYMPRIVGKGQGRTFLNASGAGSVLTFKGTTPGQFTGGYLADFSIIGTATTGITFEALTGFHWDRITLAGAGMTTGILFHNKDAGDFTEFCSGQANIEENVATAVEYRRDAGNESFHGCGLTGESTINQKTGATTPSVKVGAGAYPYNAPMHVTIWVREAAVPLFRNDGSNATNFRGTLAVELFSASCILADTAGNPVNYVGELVTQGTITGITFGDFVLASHIKAAGTASYKVVRSKLPEQAFTPTFTNFTLGSGSMEAYYTRDGDRITGSIKITLAADSSVTGTIRFTPPVPLLSSAPRRYSGSGWCYDASAGTWFTAGLLPNGSTEFIVRCFGDGVGGFHISMPANATQPMAWATSDQLFIAFDYEAA